MSGESQEAIDRARRHLRNAAREGLEASRALVDAALLARPRTRGVDPSDATDTAGSGGLAGEIKTALDAWIATLDGDQPFRMPEAVAQPLREALRAEIQRWEKRSAEDDSARPVLRAFLGLRELLWELGMRDETGERAKPRSKQTGRPKKPAKSSAQRVQRFDLED